MINTTCFKEALLESAKEVFETMIFMDLEQSYEQEEEIEGEALLGSVTFEGSIDGFSDGRLLKQIEVKQFWSDARSLENPIIMMIIDTY